MIIFGINVFVVKEFHGIPHNNAVEQYIKVFLSYSSI